MTQSTAMRAPTILDGLAQWRWFRNPWQRRGMFALLVLIVAVASFLPRTHEARLLLAPQDALVAGSLLSPTPSDGDNLVLPGLPQPIDIELAIARSNAVRGTVAKTQGDLSPPDAVKIRALRAGIIELSVQDRNAARALRTAALYSSAIRAHLAMLRDEQVATRRALLAQRLADADVQLAKAEAAVAAKVTVKRTSALRFAQGLKASYGRYLQQSARDELSADVRLVEIDKPFIDARRQVNFAPVALLVLIALFAIAYEFYVVRPPRGSARRRP